MKKSELRAFWFGLIATAVLSFLLYKYLRPRREVAPRPLLVTRKDSPKEEQVVAPEVRKDSLVSIRGIGPATEQKLNEAGITSFLHYFLFTKDDPLRSIEQLSFGERARLELAILIASGSNLLLLDEPINHLDIPSRERFEQALATFPGTILAVVHDRYFISRFATDLWIVEDGIVETRIMKSMIQEY